jgi:hypothetical protein
MCSAAVAAGRAGWKPRAEARACGCVRTYRRVRANVPMCRRARVASHLQDLPPGSASLEALDEFLSRYAAQRPGLPGRTATPVLRLHTPQVGPARWAQGPGLQCVCAAAGTPCRSPLPATSSSRLRRHPPSPQIETIDAALPAAPFGKLGDAAASLARTPSDAAARAATAPGPPGSAAPGALYSSRPNSERPLPAGLGRVLSANAASGRSHVPSETSQPGTPAHAHAAHGGAAAAAAATPPLSRRNSFSGARSPAEGALSQLNVPAAPPLARQRSAHAMSPPASAGSPARPPPSRRSQPGSATPSMPGSLAPSQPGSAPGSRPATGTSAPPPPPASGGAASPLPSRPPSHLPNTRYSRTGSAATGGGTPPAAATAAPFMVAPSSRPLSSVYLPPDRDDQPGSGAGTPPRTAAMSVPPRSPQPAPASHDASLAASAAVSRWPSYSGASTRAPSPGPAPAASASASAAPPLGRSRSLSASQRGGGGAADMSHAGGAADAPPSRGGADVSVSGSHAGGGLGSTRASLAPASAYASTAGGFAPGGVEDSLDVEMRRLMVASSASQPGTGQTAAGAEAGAHGASRPGTAQSGLMVAGPGVGGVGSRPGTGAGHAGGATTPPPQSPITAARLARVGSASARPDIVPPAHSRH